MTADSHDLILAHADVGNWLVTQRIIMTSFILH